MPLYITGSGNLNSDCVTKMFRPNGGWNMPMAKLVVITMPKCTGSIPAAFTMGMRRGVNTKMADSGSIKHPTTKNTTFKASKIIHGDNCQPWTSSTIADGIQFTVNSQPNTLAQATISRIWAVKVTERAAQAITSSQPMSL